MDQYCVVISGLQAGVSDSAAAWAPVAAAFKMDEASFAQRVLAALPLIVRQKLDKATADQIVQQLQARNVEARSLPDDAQVAHFQRDNIIRGPLPLSGLGEFLKHGELYRLLGSTEWQEWIEPLPAFELSLAQPSTPATKVPGTKTLPLSKPKQHEITLTSLAADRAQRTQVPKKNGYGITTAMIGIAVVLCMLGYYGWSHLEAPAVSQLASKSPTSDATNSPVLPQPVAESQDSKVPPDSALIPALGEATLSNLKFNGASIPRAAADVDHVEVTQKDVQSHGDGDHILVKAKVIVAITQKTGDIAATIGNSGGNGLERALAVQNLFRGTLNRGVIFNPGDEYLYLVDADFKKEGNGYEIVDGTVTLASTERVGTKQLAPENSQQALPPPDPVPAQSQSTAAVAGAMPSASSSPRGQPNATQSQSESSPIVAVIQAAERNDWASVDSQVEVLMQEIPTIQHGDRALAKRLNAQAISLLNQDDFQAGIEALVGASKADPADIEVSNNLGYAYQKAGLNTQAFEILNRTLSQSPRRAIAWENLARVYAQSGDTAASEACARITLRFSKNPTATIAFMKKVVSDDPDSPYGKVLATVIQGPPVQQSAFSSHEQSSSASSPDTNRHATNTDEPMQDADPIWIVHTVAHYPPQAERQHHTGVVVLMVTIDANGNPADIKVDQSSGFRELDRAAMDAAQRWRFKPAIKGGRAVESYMRVSENFSLNDRAGN